MGLNCSFVVKGKTIEEVIKQALDHVRENHANEFNRIQSPAEIEQMEKSLSRSTRVVSG
jgi:predicted small metal-binding protein